MRVTAFTSGRWDYDHLYWVMKGLKEKMDLTVLHPRNHHHRKEIEKEFPSGNSFNTIPAIRRINDYGMVWAICDSFFRHFKQDMLIVLGDRWEALACATAAYMNGVKIAHIHGGEPTMGSLDDGYRSCITQLADYHFTSLPEYAGNIASMVGQECWYDCITDKGYSDCSRLKIGPRDCNIFNVGAPILDHIHHGLTAKEDLKKYVDIDKPFILACFNPVTRDLECTEMHAYSFLSALIKTGKQVVLINPNIDQKSEEIRKMNAECESVTKGWRLYDNIPHKDYISLMKYADCLVGNSSAGIIEAASVGCPVVNIGYRQSGRLKGPNVFDCHDETILYAIDKAMKFDRSKTENLYGDGHSSERIVKVLEEV